MRKDVFPPFFLLAYNKRLEIDDEHKPLPPYRRWYKQDLAVVEQKLQ